MTEYDLPLSNSDAFARQNIDEERLAYAIELAKRVTDKCVANRILTEDEGHMVFDSLVDGFQLKSTNELAQALIDMEER